MDYGRLQNAPPAGSDVLFPEKIELRAYWDVEEA